MLSDRGGWQFNFLITLFLVGMIAVGEWLGLVQPLTQTLAKFFQPASVKLAQSLEIFLQPVFTLQESWQAAERVQVLEREYGLALAKISQLEYLEQENQDLRNLLGAPARQQEVAVASKVVSLGLPSVNVGQVEGVYAGQPVLAAQILVGLIETTSAHQARVKLLVQNFAQPILAQTEAGVTGLVVGDGKNILLTEIPKDAELAVGQRVVTAGQEFIQSQLLIGQIQIVIDQPAAATKQAVIKQSTSFYEVPVLEVLL